MATKKKIPSVPEKVGSDFGAQKSNKIYILFDEDKDCRGTFNSLEEIKEEFDNFYGSLEQYYVIETDESALKRVVVKTEIILQ